MKQKKWIFYGLYIILYTGVIAEFFIKSPIMNILADILVIPSSIAIIYRNKYNFSYIGKGYKLLMIIIILVGIIGAILNHATTPVAFLWTLRMILRYPLVFVAILATFNEEDIKKTKKILCTCLFINFGAELIERYVFGITGGDVLGGTFGGNGALANFVLLSLILFSSDFFHGRLSKVKFLFVISGSFMLAMLSEIKLLYFVIPLTIYGCYVFQKKFSIVHIATLVIGLLVAVPVLSSVLSLYYDDDYVTHTLNADELEKYNTNSYGFMEGGFNRGTAIELTNEVMLTDTKLKLFGYGLGSGTLADWTGATLSKRFRHTTFFYFFNSYVLAELGWVGYLAYVGIFVLLTMNFWKYYHRYHDKVIRQWAGLGLMSCLLTFLMMYYNSSPYVDHYLFTIFYAICFKAIIIRIDELGGKRTLRKR